MGHMGPVGHDRLVVLGIGNVLMRDDGLGVHILRALREELKNQGVECIEAGTSILDALDLIEPGADVLVLDAASGGEPAGSVYRFGLDDVAARRGISLHEASLPEAFALARLSGSEFGRVVVLGIEPAEIEVSTELSPALSDKLPAILATVRGEVARLL